MIQTITKRLEAEPDLSELIEEPVIQLLMRRDGVEQDMLRALFDNNNGPKKRYSPA